MPAGYKDFSDFQRCFEDWARRETFESQLNMLKIYKTLFEKGKIEMEEANLAKEYVNIRIEEMKKGQGLSEARD